MNRKSIGYIDYELKDNRIQMFDNYEPIGSDMGSTAPEVNGLQLGHLSCNKKRDTTKIYFP